MVTTASYEARRYGVTLAIPAAHARRLCPEATFIPPDHEAYRAMSKRVMDRVRAQVETVEVMGLDEAYLDPSGLVAPRRDAAPISEIKADTGLTASVGIGPTGWWRRSPPTPRSPRASWCLPASRRASAARPAVADPKHRPEDRRAWRA